MTAPPAMFIPRNLSDLAADAPSIGSQVIVQPGSVPVEATAGITTLAPGIHERRTRLVCSPVDGRQHASAVTVFAADDQYLYGATGGVLTRSADGEAWSATTIPASLVWRLIDGALLCWSSGFRRTEDRGETAIEASVQPSLSADGFFAWFGLHQAPHGTIVVGEYAGDKPAQGQRLFRSTDGGQTWATAFDRVAAGLPGFDHFHGVGYHAGQHRWLADAGDFTNRCTLYSDDDGATWDYLVPPSWAGYHNYQAMRYLDFGHDHLILCAGDNQMGIYTMDVRDGSTTWQINTLIRGSSKAFVWSFLEHDGIIYAGGVDDGAAPEHTVLLAARRSDPYRWTKILQFADRGVLNPAGLFQGRIYWSPRVSGHNYWSHEPVRPLAVPAIVLRDRSANTMADAESLPEASMIDTYADGYLSKWTPWNSSGSLALHDTGGPDGGSFVRLTQDVADLRGGIFSPLLARAGWDNDGDVLYGGLWMRAPQPTDMSMSWQNWGTNRGMQRFTITPQWRWYSMTGLKRESEFHTKIGFAIFNSIDDAPVGFTFDFARAWIGVNPSYAWHLGSRPGVDLVSLVPTGGAWSNVIGALPQQHSADLPGDAVVLRSWTADDHELQVVWEGGVGWHLRQIIGGVPGTDATIPMARWHWDMMQWFVVSASADTLSLHAWNGSGGLTASETNTLSKLQYASVRVRYGSAGNLAWLPHALAADWWYPFALSASDALSAIAANVAAKRVGSNLQLGVS